MVMRIDRKKKCTQVRDGGCGGVRWAIGHFGLFDRRGEKKVKMRNFGIVIPYFRRTERKLRLWLCIYYYFLKYSCMLYDSKEILFQNFQFFKNILVFLIPRSMRWGFLNSAHPSLSTRLLSLIAFLPLFFSSLSLSSLHSTFLFFSFFKTALLPAPNHIHFYHMAYQLT